MLAAKFRHGHAALGLTKHGHDLRLGETALSHSNAARLLGVTTKTLRLAAEAGSIEGVHPLPDGPWIFARAELSKPPAQLI